MTTARDGLRLRTAGGRGCTSTSTRAGGPRACDGRSAPGCAGSRGWRRSWSSSTGPWCTSARSRPAQGAERVSLLAEPVEGALVIGQRHASSWAPVPAGRTAPSGGRTPDLGRAGRGRAWRPCPSAVAARWPWPGCNAARAADHGFAVSARCGRGSEQTFDACAARPSTGPGPPAGVSGPGRPTKVWRVHGTLPPYAIVALVTLAGVLLFGAGVVGGRLLRPMLPRWPSRRRTSAGSTRWGRAGPRPRSATTSTPTCT